MQSYIIQTFCFKVQWLLYMCPRSQQFHQKWCAKQKFWCTRWKIDVIQTGKLLYHKYAVYLIKYKVNAHKQCYILHIEWLHQQKVNMYIKQENKIKHSVYCGLHFTACYYLKPINIPQSQTLVCSRVSQLVYLSCLTNITDFTYLGGKNLCVNCNLMSSTVGFYEFHSTVNSNCFFDSHTWYYGVANAWASGFMGQCRQM